MMLNLLPIVRTMILTREKLRDRVRTKTIWSDYRSEDSSKRGNFNSKTFYMRWIGGRESSNVEDRRGLSAGGGVAIGGGLIGVIFLVIKLLSGGDVSGDIQQQIQNQPQQMTAEEKAKDDERAKFISVVLGYTEDVWDSLFAASG